MKISKLCIAVFSLLFLYSCSSDKESTPGEDQAPTSPVPTEEVASPMITAGASEESSASNESYSDCAVDVHQHLSNGVNFSVGSATLLEVMSSTSDKSVLVNGHKGLSKVILMPPPETGDGSGLGANYQIDTNMHPSLVQAVADNSDKYFLAAGGAALNPIIHKAHIDRSAGDATAFRAEVKRLVALGIKSIGEMAVLHLSITGTHPYIVAPAFHPLYRVLVEEAAIAGIPVDIHLEAIDTKKHYSLKIPEDMPKNSEGVSCFKTVDGVGADRGLNPSEIKSNIMAFVKLLKYAKDYACNTVGDCSKSKIVWSHVGWDNTSDLNTTVVGDLMGNNSNLYAALKMLNSPGNCQSIENRPLDASGNLQAHWKSLFEKFPDRFVIGSDEFFGESADLTIGSASTQGSWDLIEKLPNELKKAFACDNPRRIYNL
ncbi:MAG: hypothetical protein HOE90_13230 [Bacteriovoracaceae bacterium]|nr:hypothetical protein [Bacteriovoracaceae bacterium]